MKTRGIDRHSNRTRSIAAAAAAAVLASIGWAPDAGAYGQREHDRLPDQAYQIINLLRRGSHLPDLVARSSGRPAPNPLTARPPSVRAEDQASWDQFLAEAIPAAQRLDLLLTDLPDPMRTSEECGGKYPTVAPGKHLSGCRAADLAFAPAGHWATDNTRCYLRRGYNFGDANEPELFQSVPTSYTGALLGYWAQNVDDLWDDTHMEIRPTNNVFLKAAVSLAEIGLEVGVAIVIAPVYCLGDLLSGDFDCLDDARDAARSVDPIRQLDEITIGDWNGEGFAGFSTTGMWHFVSPSVKGKFNQHPGLQLLAGNPFGPDGIDLAAAIVADTVGMTIAPGRSNGVRNYAPFHDGSRTRRDADWTGFSFAHVELEPLDNLAQYGWSKYNDRADAIGEADPDDKIAPNPDRRAGWHASALGWPLHAIGDAVQPHHVASTLGWGHKTWENHAGVAWPQIFEPKDAAGVYLAEQHYQDLVTVLGQAWRWWQFLKLNGDDVKAMIEAIATETLASPGARPDAIFRDILPLSYTPEELKAFYGDQVGNLKQLLMSSMGATVAFLVRASTRIDPGLTESSCAACKQGESRRGIDLAGTPLDSDVCVPCGQGVFANAPNWLDGACVGYCPEDRPYAGNGLCATSCPAADCAPCPPEKHFRDNGVCVVSCSTANPFVVDNAVCASACPAGLQADARRYCVNVVPQGPTCAMSMSSQGDAVCCVGRADTCTKDADCCSLKCGPDGLCLGRSGDSCVTAGDCVSNVCTNGHCAPAGGGGTCRSNADCASQVCRPDPNRAPAGTCQTPLGGICASGSECVAPAICTGRFVNQCCLPGSTACSKGTDCCSGECSAGFCTRTPIFVD